MSITDELREYANTRISPNKGMLFDIADRIDAEYKRMQADNAKLREQIHWLKKGDILHVLTDQEYIDQCERERLMQVSIDALDKDNAKLRELVRDLYTLHWNGLDCTECPWFDECDTTGGCPWLSIFADHMRELGVEVDDGTE